MKQEQLNKILELHKKWMQDENEGERADLRYTDLSDLDLSDANLSYADLRYANLSNLDLNGVNLRYANLSDANLKYANLSCANLISANLRCANLVYVNLSGAKLSGVNLSYANLRYAELSGADLTYVNTLLLQGMTVIECQLNTSDQNRRISYWKELDIVTAGCYQGSWGEFKERVQQVHGDNPVMKRKYDQVIAFIEAERGEEE